MSETNRLRLCRTLREVLATRVSIPAELRSIVRGGVCPQLKRFEQEKSRRITQLIDEQLEEMQKAVKAGDVEQFRHLRSRYAPAWQQLRGEFAREFLHATRSLQKIAASLPTDDGGFVED